MPTMGWMKSALHRPTTIAELKDGEVTSYTITPEQFGFKRASLDELAIDGAASSLVMVKSVLDNKAGAARDIVALNAGAAIYAANITDSLSAGIEKARAAYRQRRGKSQIRCVDRLFKNLIKTTRNHDRYARYSKKNPR